MTTVRFFTSSYAPCAVQAQILDTDLLSKVKATMKENGCEYDEDTALITWEDAEDVFRVVFSSEEWNELNRGWPVEIEMDPFDAASLYGYGSADTLLQRGAL